MIPQWLVDKVKEFEGFEPVAKWDYKQWTNGFGTRAREPREKISREEAEKRLAIELDHAAALVDHFADHLSVGVRAALIDLTFNEGTSWQHAGLGRAVLRGDLAGAKNRLLQYNRAGGKVLKALTARRKEEVSWFSRSS